MKKLFLFSLFVCIGVLQCLAETFDYTDENGVTWGCYITSVDDKTVTINSASNYGDEVVIPEMVYKGTSDKYTVTDLSLFFKDNKTLEKVTLPKTVNMLGGFSSYGDGMFQNCISLKEVLNTSQLQLIGSYTFSGCTNLTEVDLSSCVYIQSQAFFRCSNLVSVGNLKNCTSIRYSAFEDCSKLQEVGELSSCKTIESSAFQNCSSLKSLPGLKLTSIPNYAFSDCSNLETIDLSECTSIGSNAFSYCSNLSNIDTKNCQTFGEATFSNCSSLTEIDLTSCKALEKSLFAECSSLSNVIGIEKFKSIPDYAFRGTALKAVNFPLCTSVGNYAFYFCKSLTTIDFPKVEILGSNAFQITAIAKVSLPESLKSMGPSCFNSLCEYTFNGTTPAKLSGDAFGSLAIIKVPQSAVSTYKSADVWSNYADKIFSMSDNFDYDVTTTAMEKQSGLEQAIGATNMAKVVSLKATGTINSYDIIMIRNKMTNLHYLDLSAADIVANDYEYYTGSHTTANTVGRNMFRDLDKLITVKLPNSATTIGSYGMSSCSNLMTVEFPKNLTSIGGDAFSSCSSLDNVVLPNGLTTIGSWAFIHCINLKSIEFPPTLKYIGSSAFSYCSSLQEIELPGLETIESNAFYNCYSLKYVRIPSTLQSIDGNAFSGCTNISKVYTYTVEPTKINQNTFDSKTYENAHLCMPTQSYTNYYYNTEWSQFRNDNYEWFDEPYKYMYINKEYTLSDENSASKDKGRFDGDPDIDVNPGGGLIVEGDKPQTSDEIHLKGDGSNWASIIASANVDAKKLYIDITVKANRWHFFCFPFDIKRSNISCNGSFVFRYYDGKVRATDGKGGWQNLPASEEYLKAGKGYIFQTSVDCTLSILVEKEKFGMLPNMKFDCNLEANASTNEQDASWNFVGNPFTSFFDLNDMGYNAPVTRWNSNTNSYEAVRPGDDDYIFHPFEAFFVQRPADSENIEFDPDHRMTQTGRDKRQNANAQKAKKRMLNPERLLVNLTISDGKDSDKTRVVFNQKKSNTYEMDCDAAKFMSQTSAVQLYSVEAKGGKFAINERPKGSVQLGYTAAKAGEYTISAQRMDQPVMLKDNAMNVMFDLSNGDYNFTSDAGTFDNRFMLLVDGSTTGIADIANGTGVNIMPVDGGLNITGIEGKKVNIYSLSGVLCATRSDSGLLSLPKATYIVEVGNMKAKVAVK